MKKVRLFVILSLFAACGILLMLASQNDLTAQAKQDTQPGAPDAATLRYLFSGVIDDGAKGVNGKKATSIHCTNTGAASATIQVDLYSFGSILVESQYVSALAGRTYTFSTQQTVIFFDDVDFAADMINQGHGRIYSNTAAVICSAQVLDPTGYPPVFMDLLTMYHADGTIVGDVRKIFLPLMQK